MGEEADGALAVRPGPAELRAVPAYTTHVDRQNMLLKVTERGAHAERMGCVPCRYEKSLHVATEKQTPQPPLPARVEPVLLHGVSKAACITTGAGLALQTVEETSPSEGQYRLSLRDLEASNDRNHGCCLQTLHLHSCPAAIAETLQFHSPLWSLGSRHSCTWISWDPVWLLLHHDARTGNPAGHASPCNQFKAVV